MYSVGLARPNSKSVDAFGRAFIVLLVDLGLTDDLEDYVCKVRCIFCSCGLDCQHQSQVVLAEVFKEALLESHLYSLFRHLGVCPD